MTYRHRTEPKAWDTTACMSSRPLPAEEKGKGGFLSPTFRFKPVAFVFEDGMDDEEREFFAASTIRKSEDRDRLKRHTSL